MRAAVRRVLEVAVTGGGLARAARRVRRHAVAVLAYHNVVLPAEAGRGDTSLHLPLPRFISQIERLVRTHDVVDLEAAGRDGAARRPRAVITFDDAYRGAVTLALPELIRRGLPATVFASPGLLGAESTWWDELAEKGMLPDDRRRFALVELGGRSAVIRQQAFRGEAPPELPARYGIASAEELRRQCGRGIKIGSHAWGHEYLPALSRADLQENLSQALAWLRGSTLPWSSWLALPYGAGSLAIGHSALELGHEGVLRISGGLWMRRENRAGVPRINVPAGVSDRGLELRASGLLAR